MLSITHISDTNGWHEELEEEIPLADVLIHSGNYSEVCGVSSTKSFLKWFNNQPHEYKILVPGNRDFYFEKPKGHQMNTGSVQVLINDTINIDGFNFHGVSYQPTLTDGAFSLEQGLLVKEFKKIPTNTDVLISNIPPFEILDSDKEGKHCGSRELSKRLKAMQKLKLHLFGAIPESLGHNEVDKVLYLNGCCFSANKGAHPGHQVLLKKSVAEYYEKPILD